jgi:predicted nucleic acid-binding protein
LGLKLRSFAESSLLENALLVSRELKITFYDAAYVALTTDARWLITADKDFYMKTKEYSAVKLLGETKPEELTA